jgi:hypothetical protein
VRRFPAAWAVLPVVLAFALSTLSAFSLAGQDMTGVYQLLALPIAGILAFGGWERPRWLLAGVLAMLAVAAGAAANAWLTVQLLILAGVPELWLLELSAVLPVLGVPVALVAGIATAVICNRGWFRRTLPASTLP